MANIVFHLLGNAGELGNIVVNAALANPLSVFLVVVSAVLWVLAFGYFIYLVVGAIVSEFTSENIGRTPPQ